MNDSNSAMFDPRTPLMNSHDDVCVDDVDFGFAFNDIIFSDRVLHVHIFSEPIESKQSPSAVRVKTLHVSSIILAARSPFFHKLFSNGMRESEHRHVTLQINASEEAGLMELLKFTYSNNLTVTHVHAVLEVLTVADKFDVPSCMKHCNRLLRNLQMTPETVSVYLDLPSSILMAEAFQPLTIAAKKFYAVHYKDITKFQNEILSLPLAEVEAIIASDDLKVRLEDDVYHFVLKWAWTHYPERKDRREIIMTRLAKFIRYPYMTRQKLRQLLTNEEFDPEFAQKVSTEAISFKTKVPHKRSDENSNLDRRFVERAYKFRPIKMVEFEQRHGVVYFDLKRDMCARARLFPLGNVLSEIFILGGQRFCLVARCNMDTFGLYLCMLENKAGYFFEFEFDFEFAARLKPAEEFVSKFKQSCTFKGGTGVGHGNLFGIPWTWFIGEDSFCFIDGVLDLRVELTIRG
ncbi:putative chromatin remodeling & transcription regulator BTB-POZ family [Helianthus annuus]|nr:putative chromatin remodeling & transcription regulator BTB-POZ family [Helianthus annuus]KAJ0642096.1 putative chromatin remodeling & transcription regulator BTB-POZ family [Helianthus annuus]